MFEVSSTRAFRDVPSAPRGGALYGPEWKDTAARRQRSRVRSQHRRPFINKYIYWTLCKAVRVHGSPLSFTELSPLPTYTRAPSQTEYAPRAVGAWGRQSRNPEIVNRIFTTHACP